LCLVAFGIADLVFRQIMRRLIFIVALCLAASEASTKAQDVHISRRDHDEIRAVIHAATREPILRLSPVYDSHRVAGSIPVKMWRTDGFKNGKLQTTPIIQYERTDKVSVQTGSDANLSGGSYEVQKLGGKWKIVGKKGFWIH
jgi:hypothetical protein